MALEDKPAMVLSDAKVHVRFKIALLWVAIMFCYVYGDLFGFFKQETLTDIVSGKAGFIGTQWGLLAAAAVVAIPGVMPFASLVIRPTLNRWANVSLGLVYTVIIATTMPGAWMYYQFLGVVEIALSLSIVWYAWKWPRAD